MDTGSRERHTRAAKEGATGGFWALVFSSVLYLPGPQSCQRLMELKSQGPSHTWTSLRIHSTGFCFLKRAPKFYRLCTPANLEAPLCPQAKKKVKGRVLILDTIFKKHF